MDIKKTLIDIGFSFMPLWRKVERGYVEIHYKYYGIYQYNKEQTNLFIELNETSWIISDGRPHINQVYSSNDIKNQTPDLIEIMKKFIQFAGNINSK